MIILDLENKICTSKKLTETELKLLLLLSDNFIHSQLEIAEFLNIQNTKANRYIAAIISRIKSKSNINIYNISSKGYYIEDDIFIK